MNNGSTYYWVIKAWDDKSESSLGPTWYFVTMSEINNKPNKPNIPYGPTIIQVNISGTYATYGTDPDNDMIQYRFDWDAGGSHNYSHWTDLGISGHNAVLSHLWNRTGIYVVKAQSRDEHGAKSSWSEGLNIYVHEIQNDPPSTPDRPSGPKILEIGKNGTYYTKGIDPDNDMIQYRFDWDAGGYHEYSHWTSPDVSGHNNSLSHFWNNPGNYIIKAQSRDEHGALSNWSDGTTVNVRIEEIPEITIKIINPQKGLYIRDKKIITFKRNIAIIYGKITIETEINITRGSIDKVEFLIDEKLKYNDTTTPYTWTWNERILFRHRHNIKVKAYGHDGNSIYTDTDSIDIWILNLALK
jgi:hypothetical protein